MRLTTRVAAVVIGLAVAAPPTRADALPPAIDLSSFGHSDGAAGNAWMDAASDRADQPPIVPVVHGLDAPATQFYVSGIIGASFATVTTGGSRLFTDTVVRQDGSANETIFTGGGAIGLALPRPSGLLRMEVEGRARGPMSGVTTLSVDGIPVADLDARATNGWSTTVNFWRDYFLTDSLGIYAGGGFGVGGYQYLLQASDADAFLPLAGSTPVTTFAWQIGTGFVYEISDRITLDTSYRFFAMTPESTAIYVANSIGVGSFSSAFSASELLLSVRIYEPFRSWR